MIILALYASHLEKKGLPAWWWLRLPAVSLVAPVSNGEERRRWALLGAGHAHWWFSHDLGRKTHTTRNARTADSRFSILRFRKSEVALILHRISDAWSVSGVQTQEGFTCREGNNRWSSVRFLKVSKDCLLCLCSVSLDQGFLSIGVTTKVSSMKSFHWQACDRSVLHAFCYIAVTCCNRSLHHESLSKKLAESDQWN